MREKSLISTRATSKFFLVAIFSFLAAAASARAATIYLSDMVEISSSVGWGAMQYDKSIGGNRITINGVTYAKGLGVHALSTVVYNLNKLFATFTSDVGADDEMIGQGTGTVDFQVYIDDVLVYDSGTMKTNDAAKKISVSVTGKSTLKLVVTDAGDGINYDHADWAGACLTPTDPNNTPAHRIKWACIGNSITALTYPQKLDSLLGPSYSVENDGVSTMTMLKSGRNATTDAAGAYTYWTQGKLANVFALAPDIITIALGTNDSKPLNWADSANFVRDYTAMIDTLSTISSKPQIWLCLPCPAWVTTTGVADISGSTIKNSIIPRIKQVATAKGLNVIDFNTPMTNFQSLFPDNIHPNDIGSDSLAAIIYRTYAAKSTQVCCIGNSITEGAGLQIPAMQSYPAVLGMLLGRGYLVENDGHSGATMQKNRDNIPIWSYWDTGTLGHIIALKPQLITITLGANDARPDYWHTSLYIADYKAMIDTLTSNISPKPLIKLCLPIPSWQVNGAWPFSVGAATNGINNNLLRDSVVPAVRNVAQAKGLTIIDLNTPFLNGMPTLVPATDGVHPNVFGQDSLARIIYHSLPAPSMILSRPKAQTNGVASPVGKVPEITLTSAGQIRLFIPAPGRHSVSLLTLKGQCIALQSIKGAGSIFLQPEIWIPGVYVVRVVSQDGQLVSRKIVRLAGNHNTF
jgi:lysophospholipase L1-like esterase